MSWENSPSYSTTDLRANSSSRHNRYPQTIQG